MASSSPSGRIRSLDKSGSREVLGLNGRAGMLCVVFVVTQAYDTLATKYIDNSSSVGVDNQVHPFRHPFFQAFIYVLSMALCYLPWALYYRTRSQTYHVQDQAEVSVFSMNDASLSHGLGEVPYQLLLVPAVCMVMVSILTLCGLEVLNASVLQMMRGLIVLITAGIAKVLLNRHFFGFHWLGSWFIIIGLAIVGLVSISELDHNASTSTTVAPGKSTSTSTSTALGIFLIMGAQAVLAVRMVWYDDIFTRYPHSSTLRSVGIEGALAVPGLIAFIFIYHFLPGNQPNGKYLYFQNAIVQVMNNSTILALIVIDLCVMPFSHWACVSIVRELTSVHESVVSQWRALLTWIAVLIVGWEAFSVGRFFGFLIAVFGTFLFCRVINLRGALPTLYPDKAFMDEVDSAQKHRVLHDDGDEDEEDSADDRPPHQDSEVQLSEESQSEYDDKAPLLR